jgi:hypothetical protein
LCDPELADLTIVVKLTFVGSSGGGVSAVPDVKDVGEGILVATGISVGEETGCGSPIRLTLSGDAERVGLSTASGGDSGSSC